MFWLIHEQQSGTGYTYIHVWEKEFKSSALLITITESQILHGLNEFLSLLTGSVLN
jgi:hypothetical protein